MLEAKLSDFGKEISGLERLQRERKDKLDFLSKEVDVLAMEVDLLDKVEQVLHAVSTKVLGQSITTIDKLVTAGLKVVFFDQRLEFRTVVDKYRGKTSIRFELYEDGHTAPLTESYGGGVLVLIGVLLRVVTIITLKQRRVLFLDESLAHLSSQYHETASELLQKLCNELGFTVLMVTHQEGFVQNATRHYRAKRLQSGTAFEEVTKSP